MMQKIVILVCALSALAACGKAWPERKADWQAVCLEYGHKPGTPELARCVQSQEERYQAAVSRGLRDVGAALNPPTTNCTSRSYGGSTVYTTCQ